MSNVRYPRERRGNGGARCQYGQSGILEAESPEPMIDPGVRWRAREVSIMKESEEI